MKLTAAAVDRVSDTRQLFSSFTICFISIMFAGIASMLMSVYLPVAVRDLLGPVNEATMNNVSAYINSFFIFGSMIGGFTWGVVCDRIGRARAVALCTGFYGLFTLLTAFTDSWVLVCIYRLLTGFGIGGVLVTTNILVCEVWPQKTRAVALGIVSAAMPLGFIAAGAINNLFDVWQQGFLLGMVPLLTAVIGYFILTEPDAWRSEAEAGQAENKPSLFAPAYRKNLVQGSLIFGAMLIGLWAVFSWTPTWVQTVTPDEEAARQLRGLCMMILASAGLVGSVFSGYISNAIGVQRTLMMCFLACFIMVFVVFRMNTAVTTVTLVQMGVMSFFFGISQGALAVFIPQLFPVSVRAAATGFCFNIGRLFTASVVFFIGALANMLGGYGNAIFIFSFVFLAGLVITAVSSTKLQTHQ